MSVPVKIYRTVTYQEGQTPSNPNLSGDPVVNPINPNGGAAEELVPYDGAIKDVSLGEKGLSTGFVQYDTTPTDTPTGSGTVVWNPDKYTLDLSMGLGDSVQQIGMETYYTPVKNQTGSVIPNGTFVMATGSLGASGRMTVAPAVTDGSVDSKYMLGVTTHDIDPNVNDGDGLVTWFGEIRGFNTNTKAPVGETWIDSTVLWNNPAVAGGFTSVEPQAPNLKIPVAIVISAGNNGVIFVRPRLGMRLTDLHDVDAFTPSDKDLISYDSALGHWNAKSLGSVIGGTSSQFLKGDGSLDSNAYALASQINIASGQVAFGTGTGTIGGNNNLAWNNTTNRLSILGELGVGTTNPDVFGRFYTRNIGFTSSGTTILSINGTTYSGIDLGQSLTRTFFITSTATLTQFGTLVSAPLRFLTNGANRISIESTGQVGIATTSPTNTLDVNGTARIRTINNLGYASTEVLTQDPLGVVSKRTLTEFKSDLGLTSAVTGSGTTNYIPKFTASGTIGNSQIFDNGTNVGIGTSSPSAKLEVSGAGIIVKATASGSDSSYFQAVNGSYDYVAGIATSLGYGLMGMNSDYPLVIMTNATERMRITSGGNVLIGTTTDNGARLQVNGTGYFSGNVGIGTASPDAKLSVQDSYSLLSLISTTGSKRVAIGGDMFTDAYVGTTTNHNFSFISNGLINAVLTTSGNFGVGTNAPTNTLDVNGTARIRTLSNATGDFVTASATGVLQKRTASETRTDIGAIGGTIASGQVAFGTGSGTIGGDSGLVWDNTAKNLLINTTSFSANATLSISAGSFSSFIEMSGTNSIINGQNNIRFRIGGNDFMRIVSSGNVAIGNISNPTNTLDVNGTVRIRSLTGTTGYLPLLSSTGVIGQSVAYNANTGIVINGTFLPSGAVFSVNGVSYFNNWATAGAYDKLSIDFGENRGFGYDPTPNEIFVKGATTVPVKIDTDAPTDSLNVLSTGGIKMANIPSGTIANAVGLDSNNELVKGTAVSQFADNESINSAGFTNVITPTSDTEYSFTFSSFDRSAAVGTTYEFEFGAIIVWQNATDINDFKAIIDITSNLSTLLPLIPTATSFPNHYIFKISVTRTNDGWIQVYDARGGSSQLDSRMRYTINTTTTYTGSVTPKLGLKTPTSAFTTGDYIRFLYMNKRRIK